MSKDVKDRLGDSACSCGHSFGSHYGFNMAMPCGCCACERCDGVYADAARAGRVRRGLADHPPGDGWLVARAAYLRGEPVPRLLVLTPLMRKRRRLRLRRERARRLRMG